MILSRRSRFWIPSETTQGTFMGISWKSSTGQLSCHLKHITISPPSLPFSRTWRNRAHTSPTSGFLVSLSVERAVSLKLWWDYAGGDSALKV